ncbi:hypothetical protein HELRODRAFT_159520 [Helobdella robusta]|uniref:Uncharacterized protein n=1 Tax=Helobdella robusta TaxID=6412 RepID=T1EP43_HELRO|nr:hypothetical protein HELRODRAFT_159520 [Helobdella robusta]ESO12931.1 hypothetical protein HELRODRAFT_159520 [Helobdella robusta]
MKRTRSCTEAYENHLHTYFHNKDYRGVCRQTNLSTVESNANEMVENSSNFLKIFKNLKLGAPCQMTLLTVPSPLPGPAGINKHYHIIFFIILIIVAIVHITWIYFVRLQMKKASRVTKVALDCFHSIKRDIKHRCRQQQRRNQPNINNNNSNNINNNNQDHNQHLISTSSSSSTSSSLSSLQMINRLESDYSRLFVNPLIENTRSIVRSHCNFSSPYNEYFTSSANSINFLIIVRTSKINSNFVTVSLVIASVTLLNSASIMRVLVCVVKFLRRLFKETFAALKTLTDKLDLTTASSIVSSLLSPDHFRCRPLFPAFFQSFSKSTFKYLSSSPS